jgi:tRNA-specific 2-thiouridylase
MSGGVDSSVAAALLLEQGYTVKGVTMRFPSGMGPVGVAEKAAQVAEKLGIPHQVIDVGEAFRTRVIDYFVREYSQGRTPNPCLACNTYIKFGALWTQVRRMGIRRLATGHYVRREWHPGRSRYLLRRGADAGKDQSYVLYGLSQSQLAGALFPLGELSKTEVRRLAATLALPVQASESQEICFVKGDYREFLQKIAPGIAQPGPILDMAGNELGTHRGLSFYTIGQRRGLGLAAGQPLYVVGLDAGQNAVIVGPAKDLLQDALIARDVNWILFQDLTGTCHVQAQIRYNGRPAGAKVSRLDAERVLVKFEQPQRAITPGQAVVFYQGDLVVGGGVIDVVGEA